MFHVSFRYIFGLPPLILVLLPVASSDCDIEGKDGKQYESVLMVSIDQLLNQPYKKKEKRTERKQQSAMSNN
ncbi:IL7 isoform 10, partial [Pan troglodytes]|uniref:Interleukin-7 n=6 Tax=Hominoidea TaxID=314295 RepID=Q5FBY3_HUMAN|nr:interleukin 7 [Homo sapiens]PNI56315.1 IL7 isoform 6 [Pan troglodytes]KAI2550410.1 interleukin 7 [Homo sapiens]KAI4011051.1 interleukin 7 [Homo sapiens]KAI4011053.1 interleukin 7 [Homo sapiens]